MKEFNTNDYVFFVLRSNFINRAHNSFVLNYYDKKIEDDFVYKDFKGNPLRYSFNKSHRTIRVSAGKKELINAIRNHPQCKDSINGSYTNVGKERVQTGILFSEMNNEIDAKENISAAKSRSNAMTKAFEIFNDESLTEEVSLVLGISDIGSMSHSKIIMYAENNPVNFLKEVNSSDFKARAIAKKAINLDIISLEGVIYMCGNFSYGIDLDEVVKTLIKDKDKMYLVKKKLGMDLDSK